MASQKKLSSLSIFFPFFNDEGTVSEAIEKAYLVGNSVASDLEVIAIHGGNSSDNTLQKIKEVQKKHKDLKILNHEDNHIGYAVIKYGFLAATKDWIFYTDGDLQYDVNELTILVDVQRRTQADVVNGYKTNRNDTIHRRILGRTYQFITKLLFHLPIRDLDCDFRLIRRSVLKTITLEATNAAILTELIYKLDQLPITFAEVLVSHFSRKYGDSNYTWWRLTWEKITGDGELYWKIMKTTYSPEKSHS